MLQKFIDATTGWEQLETTSDDIQRARRVLKHLAESSTPGEPPSKHQAVVYGALFNYRLLDVVASVYNILPGEIAPAKQRAAEVLMPTRLVTFNSALWCDSTNMAFYRIVKGFSRTGPNSWSRQDGI